MLSCWYDTLTDEHSWMSQKLVLTTLLWQMSTRADLMVSMAKVNKANNRVI